MFYGTHEHTIDEKNRLTLPAKFRDGLGGDVVLVRGIDGTIDVYPRRAGSRVSSGSQLSTRSRGRHAR
jgi:MraZ protein